MARTPRAMCGPHHVSVSAGVSATRQTGAVPTRRPGRSTPPPEDQPYLRLPLRRAQDELGERIRAGQELLSSNRSIDSEQTLEEARRRYLTWNDYNAAWLERHVGKRIASEYSRSFPILVAGATSPIERFRDLQEDVQRKVRRLESVVERLPLWADEGTDTAADTAVPTTRA